MLGPAAFEQGKGGALGTLRHEMKHAEHFQMMIDWLAKWREDVKRKGAVPKLEDAAARTRFDAWIDSHKGVSKVERSLLLGERNKNHANTEVLAYIEGFINIFHLRQDPPTLKVGSREQAKNAAPEDVPAAKLLHNDFKPLAGFIKQLQGLV